MALTRCSNMAPRLLQAIWSRHSFTAIQLKAAMATIEKVIMALRFNVFTTLGSRRLNNGRAAILRMTRRNARTRNRTFGTFFSS